MAEATCCDLPVIASNWSGQLDFLNPKQSIMLDGELKPIPKSLIWKPIIVEPGKWFNVSEQVSVDDAVKSAMGDKEIGVIVIHDKNWKELEPSLRKKLSNKIYTIFLL